MVFEDLGHILKQEYEALFYYVHFLVVWVALHLLVIMWPQDFIWKSRLVLKAHLVSPSSHRWTIWTHFHIKSTSTSQRRLILFEMNMLCIVLIRHAPLFFFFKARCSPVTTKTCSVCFLRHWPTFLQRHFLPSLEVSLMLFLQDFVSN